MTEGLAWHGYAFNNLYNVNTGDGSIHAYKLENGQLVDQGKIGGDLGGKSFEIIPGTDIAVASLGVMYKIADNGNGVSSELLGQAPSGKLKKAYGGYIFGEDYSSTKRYLTAVDSQNPTQIASIIEVSPMQLSGDGSGVGIDPTTEELVVTTTGGKIRIYQLPALIDGKLSPDFSLNDLVQIEEIQMPGAPGTIIANNGYKYFGRAVAFDIVDPQGNIFTITKHQLFPQSTNQLEFMAISELEKNGIYVRLKYGSTGIGALITIKPTTDSAKFIAPGVPFEAVEDTGPQAESVLECTVIPQEYQQFFADPDPIDPCLTATCDDGNLCTTDTCTNELGVAVCDNIVTPGASCSDGDLCTTQDVCTNEGTCEGAPVTCAVLDQCHSVSCNGTTGACEQTPLTGKLCDDGDKNTINDTCQAGTCVGVEIPVEQDPDHEVVEEDPDVIEDTGADVEDDVPPDTTDTGPDTTHPEISTDSKDATDTNHPEVTVIDNNPDIGKPDLNGNDIDVAQDPDSDVTEDDATEVDSVEQDPTIKPDTDTPKKPGSCDASGSRQPQGLKGTLFTLTLAMAALLGLRKRKQS